MFTFILGLALHVSTSCCRRFIAQNKNILSNEEARLLSNAQQLTYLDETYVTDVSLDGNWLAFEGTGRNHRNSCFKQAYVLDLTRTLLPPRRISPGFGSAQQPKFYPDGKHLVLASTHLKWGFKRDIELASGGKCPTYCDGHEAQLSALGISCEAADVFPGSVEEYWPEFDLFRVSSDGRIVAQLTESDGFDGDASVSPDGETVVYTSFASGVCALWLMNATDGSSKRQVTFDQVTCPRRGSFSSDVKQIVFDAVPSSNTTRERDDHELARLHICDERRREIFILDLDSSALRQVTHLEEQSTQARFVPYSRDIIFTHTDGTLVEDLSTSSKQLYLTDQSGGTARQVTYKGTNRDAVFDNFGTKLYWTSSTRNETSVLTTYTVFAVYAADWLSVVANPPLRDGGKRVCRSANGSKLPGTSECFLIVPHQLTFGGVNINPAFGNDATYVAYESRDASTSTGSQIRVVGTPGQTPSYISGRLSSGFGANESPFVFIDTSAYRQHGHLQETIVYATTVLSEQPEHGNRTDTIGVRIEIEEIDYLPLLPLCLEINPAMDLIKVNRFGQLEARLTEQPGCDMEPAASPDGTTIVFTSCRSGRPELWLMDSDGSKPRQLTYRDGYEGGARFSGDGKKIVFYGTTNLEENESSMRCVSLKQTEIFVIDADGKHLRQVTSLGRRNWTPTFSSDSEWIMFSSNHVNASSFQLYLIRDDGTMLTQVTFNDAGIDAYPAFSSKGNYLTWSSTRNASSLDELNVFYAKWIG